MRVPIRVSTEDTGGAYPGTLEMMLVEWKKKPGERVEVGEELAVIQTEKAEQCLVARVQGRLQEITIAAGGEFTVMSSRTEEEGGRTFYQTVLGYLEVDPSEKEEQLARHAPEGEETERVPSVRITPVARKMLQYHGIAESAEILHAIGANSRGVVDRAEVERYLARRRQLKRAQGGMEGDKEAEIVEHTLPPESVEDKTGLADSGARFARPVTSDTISGASPAARILARQEGVDLGLVQGTGPGGIVVPEDVMRYLAGERNRAAFEIDVRAESVELRVSPPGKEIRAISRIQQAVARNLTESWRKPTAQDSWTWHVMDLVYFHRSEKDELERIFGVKVSLMAPLLLGLTRVLAREEFWRFNGAVQETADGSEKLVFVKSTNVHLGIAFNTSDDNLVILTMRDANLQSLEDFVKGLSVLQSKAREKTYTVHDVTGYSFIFNNIGGLDSLIPQHLRGSISHRFGYSLLSGDTSALLNIGSIGVTHDATVQLSFDHRIINGGHALRFIVAVYQEVFERVVPELKDLCAARRIKPPPEDLPPAVALAAE